MSEDLDKLEFFELYLKAGSDSTPAEMLVILSQNTDRRIRLRVAENPRTPYESLESLAGDEWVEVRLAIANHCCVLPETVEKLAKDDDPSVRYGLAEDPNVALPILELLSLDSNPYVAARATRTLRRLQILEAEPLECHPVFRIQSSDRDPDQRIASA